VNDVIPARVRFTAAAMPPKPAPMIATLGEETSGVLMMLAPGARARKSQEYLNGMSPAFQPDFTTER
jgi:hypothetical protein